MNPLKNQGANVWIFGSRARGDHQEYSDLDLMVSADIDISANR
ncbi:MAG: nucleotidyltransferase domain-containing protein [Proteobacteria bacterium]|nr:nucleotidyltransferase domain-containing protein [Pseudomonadota bacterium]